MNDVERAKLLASLVAYVDKKFESVEERLNELDENISVPLLQEEIIGPQGPQGPAGIRGETGPRGPQGLSGPSGAQGEQGPQGEKGEQGEKGDTGDEGPTGPQGDVGPSGPRGEQGIQGPSGRDGVDGQQGPQGERGPVGPRGPQGERGLDGKDGSDGKDGADGRDGERGAQGPQGERGVTGLQGPQGPQGPAGIQGEQGPAGPEGPQGPKGEDGETPDIKPIIGDVEKFKAEIRRTLTTGGSSSGGGEVRLEFLDDVDRDSVKQNGKFLKYNATTGKFEGATVSGGGGTDQYLEVANAAVYLEVANAGIYLEVANLTNIPSHIVPSANVTYDLGTSEKRWRDLYLSGSSIELGDATITAHANGAIDLPAGSTVASQAISAGGGGSGLNQSQVDARVVAGTTKFAEVANVQSLAALANTNAFITSVDNQRNADLANTNARINAISGGSSADGIARAGIVATNTAIRILVDDRMQVANVNTLVDDRLQVANAAIYAEVANVQSLAALANTNAYIATKLDASSYTTADVQDKAALANTNAYINSVLANTNAYIDSIDTSIVDPAISSVAGLPVLTAGITAAEVRSVIGAGTSSFDGDYSSLTNTPSIPSVSEYITVANAAVYAEVANVQSIAALANTNSAIANKLDSTSYTTADVQDKAALANTNSAISERVEKAGDTMTGLLTLSGAPTDNLHAATKLYVDTEVAAIVNGAPESLNTLNELAAALGDSNNFASAVTTNLGQKLGATATVTLTGDVTGTASFSSNSLSLSTTDTNLANTNSFIATKLDSSSYTTADVQTKAALGNTNSRIASVETDVADRLQVANVSIYAEVANVQSLAALANTNAFIATKLDSSSYTTADVQIKAALANTNAFIATKLDSSSYTTADVQTKAALANTNSAIANKLDSSSYTTADVQTKAALANTNSAIANKLDSSSYTTADVQTKAALANTNSYINSKANTSSFSAFGFSLVDDANASAARNTLGLATVASSGNYSDLSGIVEIYNSAGTKIFPS